MYRGWKAHIFLVLESLADVDVIFQAKSIKIREDSNYFCMSANSILKIKIHLLDYFFEK